MRHYKTYAWYFPNWHPTPLNDRWHGKDWTEWECVKYARPRFEGHQQPRIPLWGYEDESDPKVMEKKIKTAREYGLDGFIFDFYWFKDLGPYRRDCLDKGFLGASNNEDMEFSIMWCNHDPIYVHPASYKHENPQLTSGDVTEEFVKEVTDYCIEHYFPRKNYQRIDGKVYFAIWNMQKFIANFGSVERTAEILQDFRDRARKAGFELHLASNKIGLPYYNDQPGDNALIFSGTMKDQALYNETIQKLGLDSVFEYNWRRPQSKNWPIIEYSELRDFNIWMYEHDVDFVDVPVDITVALGWDSSPRTVPSDKYENTGYPFLPIARNNTPEEVEKSFRIAKDFLDSGKSKANMFTISCWNEWTEGNSLEPDNVNGYGYLEAFKRVFGEK